MPAHEAAVEKEADAFAAALLAPADMIKRYRSIDTLPEMSKILVASEEMLKWRIRNIDKYGKQARSAKGAER